MKQVLGSKCAIIVLLLAFGAFSSTLGQTPTPDPFITQLTSSPIGVLGNTFMSSGSDISANGRFVVFESNGNVATHNPNNADGNREIFLADYAQRRIFQLTNTRNVPRPASSPTPTPTPSPSPSPTPTPAPTPADPNQIQIEISNNRPMISYEPALVGGVRVYTIVFSSNAPNPANYDGTTSAGDANQEIWIYQLPAVADANLTTGDDFFQDLTLGTFAQITNTTASRPIRTAVVPTDSLDDNREAMISDNGDVIAFISTRSVVGTSNNDFNPDLFLATRTAANWTTFNMVQATNTQDQVQGVGRIFQTNPSLSADGSVIAFMSTANLSGSNNDSNGSGNGEVYVANVTSTGLTSIRQVTRTRQDPVVNGTVNLLSPGRRLSRDGNLIVLESLATDPKANNTSTNTTFYGLFVYNVATDTFTLAAPRATTAPGDIVRLPVFTDYAGLTPNSIVWASALNYKSDGTFPAADQTATGLNPNNQPQLYAATLPAGTGSVFSRLTINPVGGFSGIRPLASSSRSRIAFSMGGSELGGGNLDGSVELFYLFVPAIASENSAALSFFAGASNFPVAAATPVPSPSPSPTPTPTPGTIAFGLAAGELSIVRSTVALAPVDKIGVGGPETARSPILPIELSGVSVSINGAAAGLYFIGNDPSDGIRFVVPPGVTAGVRNVVVNNNGTVFRGLLNIVPAQPDIFTSTNDAGGIAVVCNVTDPLAVGCPGAGGPFPLQSSNGSTNVATVLELWLTGVRGVTTTEATVRIGTTSITPSSVRRNTNQYGFDLITFTLPSTLTPGTYPIIVSVNKGGTFQSRAEATAPSITIAP